MSCPYNGRLAAHSSRVSADDVDAGGRKLKLDAEHLDAEHLYAEHGVDSGAGSFDRGLAAFQGGKRRLLGVWRWRWSGGLVRGRLLHSRLC